ncbi:MAG: bifunctional 4-hydroxy-3-methylbut-2-enyl diphosphate reductase/30S ribosomal protein S1 [Papillibacter sp.]|jgi:4-hydroxy-3-methylbut-2-enyl diphosphate reductase|nr:bifunctional 4-hydroxy-3-methylbut-2-enyl diphosphate reductase/30S ribosomal protein S1 [Papillibacter sp.]
MEIIVAENAGFCYGVRRAIDIAEKEAGNAGAACWSLGELIHNGKETQRLERLGIHKAGAIEDIPSGSKVIIRSHGQPQSVYDELIRHGCSIVDATCPNVEFIHRKVKEASDKGRQVIIIGEREHPEVQGICGSCKDALVFKNENEILNWLKDGAVNKETPITVVFQTTEIRKQAKICDEILKKEYTNHELFDTICDATLKRQSEAAELASICEAMIVIGDRNSANSRRLYEICSGLCPKVFFIESASELKLSQLKNINKLGVTAGASTPAWIIKEVLSAMTDEMIMEKDTLEAQIPAEGEAAPVDREESFDEMLEKSLKTLLTGEKVTGIVESISPTEVTVDLGAKHSGYIPISELSDDPDLKPEDIVQIGSEIEAYVLRVNDVEGTAMLSKKRLDTVKNWETVESAKESKAVLTGTVMEENKGGLVVNVKGIRVFVPASQTGLSKNANMSELLKTKVDLRITEVNHSRRRVVGSIRAVQYENRKAQAEKTWSEIEEGKKYHGIVKSLTSYGAFVDIGGVDGMVHVSELSWNRVKNPSEVLNVGDEIDVFVLSFDKEKKRISLGYRTAEDNPWTKFTSSYNVGDVVQVKVVKLMPFGAFAQIIPGVDGLIHVSQITNERRIGKPDEVLKEGQEVEVKITGIDNDNKKVSLSIRALMEKEPVKAEAGQDKVVYDTDAPGAYNEE